MAIPSPSGGRGGTSRSQLVAIVIATIAISFVVDFSRKAVESYRVRLRAVELGHMIDRAEAERERLQALKAFMQTDAFIERAAREEFGMGWPGEVQVVIIPGPPPATPPPPPTPTPRPKEEETPRWQEWWALFSDAPPPGAF